MKVAFYTLGCKLNFSETSTISRKFEEEGHIKVDFNDHPDIFVINTCSVTDNADKKCRKVVREALEVSPKAYIAIIGCYAQLKPEEIAEIPGVDLVLGASEKFQLLDKVKSFEKKNEEKAEVFAREIEEAKRFNHSYSIHDRTRTFLKVQDGCNYKCAFCTIPLARGKSRSDTIENILKTAHEVAETETKEVVLTGVNIGDFGIVEGRRQERFIDLVSALDEVEGIERYRISSIEPNLLSNNIIDIVSESEKFMPHFHIPLQSGSDEILKSMRRRYKTDLYKQRVEYIKDQMPHASIGVDVITGFPGESEDHFLETYNFLMELDISYLHVFTYSERDNTDAAKLNDIVPKKTRSQRSKMLRNLSEKKKRKFYQDHIGEVREVLFEAEVENGFLSGYTDNYIRVKTSFDPVMINEIHKMKLNQIDNDGLVNTYEFIPGKILV